MRESSDETKDQSIISYKFSELRSYKLNTTNVSSLNTSL